MARGSNSRDGRVARSERGSQDRLGQALGRDQAEQYLIKNATRGYPADANDLRAQYGEESYEMRANGMRAPSYDKWLSEQVGRRVRGQERAAKEEKLKSTKEGQIIETSFLFAKELYKESTANVEAARKKLSDRVKEDTGMNLDAYIRNKTLARQKTDVVDAELKSKYPAEHAELERVAEINKKRYAEYEKREKARQDFLAP